MPSASDASIDPATKQIKAGETVGNLGGQKDESGLGKLINVSKKVFESWMRPQQYEIRTQPDKQIIDNEGLLQGKGTVDPFNVRVRAVKDIKLGNVYLDSQTAVFDSSGKVYIGNEQLSGMARGGLDLVKGSLKGGVKNSLPKVEALLAGVEAEAGMGAVICGYELEFKVSGSVLSIGGGLAIHLKRKGYD